MIFFLLMLCAFGIGTLIALQPVVNASMANTLGNPLMASMISMCMSIVFVGFAWLGSGNGEGRWTEISTLPWWVIIGGVAGALIVCGGLLIVPIIGVQRFFLCLIAGQVICAALVDHFGLFGLTETSVSLSRAVGIALVFIGAYMTHSNILD